MIGGIYKIVNLVNGKLYIGSAIYFRRRWAEHKSGLRKNKHHSQRLQNAWNKYGADAFEFKILEIIEDSIKLIEREQYWLDLLKSYDRNIGYNLRQRAESNLGYKHNEEYSKRLSILHKGRRASAETKIKMSLAKIGNIINNGRKLTKEHIEKCRMSNIGRKHLPETIARMSAAQKKNKALRDFNKWPHWGGFRCKCKECRKKKSELASARYLKNKSKDDQSCYMGIGFGV